MPGDFRRRGLRCLLVCAAFALALGAGDGWAQALVSPSSAQVFHKGTGYAIVEQPDGKVIIGGFFRYINGVARHGLARLNADGSLDTSWSPSFSSGGVLRMVLDASGNLYVAGNMTLAGASGLSRLLKIPTSGNGSPDNSWNPAPDGDVVAMCLDGAGNLFVGGYFSSIGGQARTGLAKLATIGTGNADASWNPNPQYILGSFVGEGTPYDLACDGAGNVYVAGSFTRIGGVDRNNLARVPTSGSGQADGWNPNSNNAVEALVLAGSSVFIGGPFATVGGQSRSSLAKLSSLGSGAVDAAWNPGATGPHPQVRALAVGDGFLYVAGSFTAIGGQSRRGLARVTTASPATLDAWDPAADDESETVSVGAGRVYAGGEFSEIGGQYKTGVAALGKQSAAAEPAWPMLLVAGYVNAIARDASNRIIIGGRFHAVGTGAIPRAHIARLNADGSVDASWSPRADGEVVTLAIGQGGSVFAGSQYTLDGGLSRTRIAKLDPNSGSTDPGWNPVLNNVRAIAADNSGNLFVVGSVTTGGNTRQVAKFSQSGTGTHDQTWSPVHDNTVYRLAHDGGDGLYLAGDFTTFGGSPRPGLARISGATASLDPAWNPVGITLNGLLGMQAIALDTQGNVYAGGSFVVGSPVRNNVVKLLPGTGAVDHAWLASTAPGQGVWSLALDGAGRLLIGGESFTIAGQFRRALARVQAGGSGALDSWTPNIRQLTNPGFVRAIALDAAGNVCVGGSFDTVDGQARFGFGCMNPVPVGTPPEFTTSSTATLVVRTQGSFTVGASGTPAPTLSHTSGALPAGVSFAAATGLISGTPQPGSVGAYALTLTATNAAGSATQGLTLTVVKADQAIDFPPIADRVHSKLALALTASASSGLAVTFTSATPAVCSVSGTNLFMSTAGLCGIYADQAGDADFNAAAQVLQTFNITPAASGARLRIAR